MFPLNSHCGGKSFNVIANFILQRNMINDGIAIAAEADITILALGLDCSIEGEDTGFDDDYTISGDKRSLYLPATQQNQYVMTKSQP